jgi:hypothetical protein
LSPGKFTKLKTEHRLNRDLPSGVQADLLLSKISRPFDGQFKQKLPQELSWRSHRTALEATARTADGHRTPERAPADKPLPVRGVHRYSHLEAKSGSSQKQIGARQPFDPSRVVVTKPIIPGQLFLEVLDHPQGSKALQSAHKQPDRQAKRRTYGSSSKPTLLLDNPREAAHASHHVPSEDITFRPPNYQASENSLKSFGWQSTYLNIMNEQHSTPSKFKRNFNRPIRDSIEEASTLNRNERASRKESIGTDVALQKAIPSQLPQNRKESSDGFYQVNLDDFCSKTQSFGVERGLSFFGEPRTLDLSSQAAHDERRLNETKSGQSKATNLFLMAGKQSPLAPHGTRASLSDLGSKHQDLQKTTLQGSLKDYKIQEPDLPSFDVKASPRDHKSTTATNEALKDTFKNIDLFASMQDFPPAHKQITSEATKAESILPIDFINTFNSKDIQFLREPIADKPVSTKNILYDFESLDCFTKTKPFEQENPGPKPTAPAGLNPTKLSPQCNFQKLTSYPQQLNPKPQTTKKSQSPVLKPSVSQSSVSPPKPRPKTPLKTIKPSK